MCNPGPPQVWGRHLCLLVPCPVYPAPLRHTAAGGTGGTDGARTVRLEACPTRPAHPPDTQVGKFQTTRHSDRLRLVIRTQPRSQARRHRKIPASAPSQNRCRRPIDTLFRGPLNFASQDFKQRD